MDKRIVIVAVVIIIVAIAAVAYVALDDDDDSKKDFSETAIGGVGTYVPIYGNATGDLYINQDDVDMLQQIVDGDLVWDKTKSPYADANLDGSITEADIQIVKNIIDSKSCTVYYENYFGEPQKINFPLVNRNIAVTYSQQAEACSILGLMDNIKVASRAATDLYSNLYPHLKEAVPWGSTGSSAIDDDAVEKFLNNDISVIVCTPRTENKEICDRLSSERNMDIIMLWYAGEYAIPTIQTMGILFDAQDKSQKYMDYANGITEDLKTKITDNVKKSILVVRNATASSGNVRLMVSDIHGSVYMIDTYLGNAYKTDTTNQFGFLNVTTEWVIENNQKFDYFALIWYPAGYADGDNGYNTQADYNSSFETVTSNLERTNAYRNGNIVSTSYDNMFSFSAYAFLKILAAQIYPDLFSLEDAIKDLQNWFDTVDICNVDVSKDGTYIYTGSNYKTSYPQTV